MIQVFLQVALGGAIGSAARHGVNLLGMRWLPGLPLGTFVVNLVGSFLIGLVAAALALRGGAGAAPFVMTGLLGGFTTFSAFSLDVLVLWGRGQIWGAGLYVLASVVLSILAVFGGFSLGQAIWAGRGI